MISAFFQSLFDLGGYRWPLTYSTWTPTIVSFNFLNCSTIYYFLQFLGLKLWSCFQALNDFFLENGKTHCIWNGLVVEICIPQIIVSNQVSYIYNGYLMPKLRPREADVQIYPNEAHILLALHLLGLSFWMFKAFHCFSIIIRSFSLIVTQFRRHVAITSLLRDKLS